MTAWAGYYLRDPRARRTPGLLEGIRRLVSRRPDDTPNVVQFDRAALIYVESGAFDTSSIFVSPGTGASLVAGEPLLSGSTPSSRTADITLLHDAWNREAFSETARATACFAAVHYNERTQRLSLIADKLGVRPIYYAVTDDVVYFAGALRVLEQLEGLRKVVDVLGAVETLSVGHPLADRTPYRDIFAIRDAEIVTFGNREIQRTRYWNIARVAEDRISLPDAAERLHTLLSRAIDRRLGDDRTSVAFLSGGLDSRCIIAELVGRGVRLHTFNFADEGTKDQILGDGFAAVVQTVHGRIPRPPQPIHWSMTMADVWGNSDKRAQMPPERPQLIWSGDGGSVSLGFVGVYPSVMSLLREGKRDEAIDRYFAERGISVPVRVFRPTVAQGLRRLVHQSVREALDEVHVDDPARDLWFFRMVHGQRRHMHTLHFEDIDLHRLEFQMPFYDWELIEAMAATPLDYAVNHRMYHAALQFFPASIGKIAWQTYPGHEPCPVPLPPGAIDQWGAKQKDIARRRRRRRIVGDTTRVLFSRSFPRSVLDRRYLMAVSLAHWLGMGDYAYAVDYARAFTTMSSVSGGRWEFAPLAPTGV